MQKNQRSLTEKLLFDYYLISSVREDEIFSPFPFYIDRAVFDKMAKASQILDNLVQRIILKTINSSIPFTISDFPLQEQIIKLTTPLKDFFWVRYDAFMRAEGGIFFSEFNYDKPCAQREIIISDMMQPYNNPNNNFLSAFSAGFEKLWQDFGQNKAKPKVAILVDPTHYEEMHLAYLYIDILKPLGYEFIIAGGNNLSVCDDKVFVFGQEIDIILRQYPTEFLHEVTDFHKILELFQRGKVLLINDPRAIIGQAKSLFAYFWEMVEGRDPFLTDEEIQVIKETIPYTTLFKQKLTNELINNKDKYVIKAIFGRYSEEVYIGKMHTMEEWQETIQYVMLHESEYIVQEFCPIKKEMILKYNGVTFESVEAFGNFGIYMTNGEQTGICLRWSQDYLTTDDMVWFTPVGIRDKSISLLNLAPTCREQKWQEINDAAAFCWGYTGGYTGNQEAFSLQALALSNESLAEISEATKQLGIVFKKTTRFVQNNKEIFCPVLGIDDKLQKLVSQQETDYLTFIGRLDWVIDTKGELKLLEFNAETPAGLMESIVLNWIVEKKFGPGFQNPNSALRHLVTEVFDGIIKDFQKIKEIKNVGLVSGLYYEDWYNTTILYEQIKDLPYNMILGEVSGIEVKNKQLYLYGTPLDAIYRYYPLDWFAKDPYYTGVTEAMVDGTLSVNHPSTFISQSKAFLALIWELASQGFYNEKEYNLINRYIPKTTLEPGHFNDGDFCIKPYFGREGEQVFFSIDYPSAQTIQGDWVYQQRIDIQPVEIDIYTTINYSREQVYPIIGAYIVGNEFAGLYTRAGGRITDKGAIYVPTLIIK